MEFKHEVGALVGLETEQGTLLKSIKDRREHMYCDGDEMATCAQYLIDDEGTDAWVHEDRLEAFPDSDGGPVTLRISIPSEGKTQEEVDAEIDKIKAVFGDILEASGLSRDSFREVSREHVDDGI